MEQAQSDQPTLLESETFRKIALSSAPSVAGAAASVLTGNPLVGAAATSAVNYACRENPEAVVGVSQVGAVIAVGLGVTVVEVIAGPVILAGLAVAGIAAAIQHFHKS